MTSNAAHFTVTTQMGALEASQINRRELKKLKTIVKNNIPRAQNRQNSRDENKGDHVLPSSKKSVADSLIGRFSNLKPAKKFPTRSQIDTLLSKIFTDEKK
jgi:hypothetical protein